MAGSNRTTGIMPQRSLLIAKITIAEPVINASTDAVRIRAIPATVSVVAISVATAIVTAAAAEQPVERFKDWYVDAGAGDRCHGAQQGDRQKQSSDVESHIGFLGESERTEATTGNRANAGERSRHGVSAGKLNAERLRENSKLTQVWKQITFGQM